MNVLFILNDAPAEKGRSLNALRLACSLSSRPSIYVRVFLIGSAAVCARKHHGPAVASDDAVALLDAVIRRGGDVRVCETCTDEQSACADDLLEGTTLASLSELARWVPEADRLLVF